MSKSVIVQIGRLDTRYRSKIKFQYNGKIGEAELSSDFLLNNEEFENTKQLIIFPKSIVFQDYLINSELLIESDSFVKLLKELDVEEYLYNPKPILNNHPHVKTETDLLVLPSLGEYKFKNKSIKLQTSLDLITIQIYLYLIKAYANAEDEKIYLDISSGHNIYITALINAAHRYLPFVRFKRFLEDEKNKFSGYIMSSEPILPGANHPIKIDKSFFTAKAFNTFTYKDSVPICNLVKKVFKEQDYYRELYDFVDKQYFLLHGAFTYGIPFLILLTNKDVLSKLFIEVGMNKMLSDFYDFVSENENEKFNTNEVYSLTYAIALSHSVYTEFKEVIDAKQIEFEIEGAKLTNKLLKKAYSAVSELYGQPDPAYNNEVINIFKDYTDVKPEGIDFYSGAQLKKLSNPTYKVSKVFDSRNYFAHYGCELNCFEIKVEKDKVITRYNNLVNFNSILRYLKK